MSVWNVKGEISWGLQAVWLEDVLSRHWRLLR